MRRCEGPAVTEKDVESSPLREEPDFDAIAEEEYWRHCDEAHGGKPCTCGAGLREAITRALLVKEASGG